MALRDRVASLPQPAGGERAPAGAPRRGDAQPARRRPAGARPDARAGRDRGGAPSRDRRARRGAADRRRSCETSRGSRTRRSPRCSSCPSAPCARGSTGRASISRKSWSDSSHDVSGRPRAPVRAAGRRAVPRRAARRSTRISRRAPSARRELEELRGTVALLGRLPPVHAPAGFVDRVVETAYRPSWPRRVRRRAVPPAAREAAARGGRRRPGGRLGALRVPARAGGPAGRAPGDARGARVGSFTGRRRLRRPTTSEVSQASPRPTRRPRRRAGWPSWRRSGSRRPARGAAAGFRLRPRRSASTRTSRRRPPRPARRRRRRPRRPRSRRSRRRPRPKKETVDQRREDTAARDVSVRRPSEAGPVGRAGAVAGCRRIARARRRRPRSPRHRPPRRAAARAVRARLRGRRPRPSARPEPFSAAKSRARGAAHARRRTRAGAWWYPRPSRPRSPSTRCWDAWAAPVWRGGSRAPEGLILVDVIVSAARYPELRRGSREDRPLDHRARAEDASLAGPRRSRRQRRALTAPASARSGNFLRRGRSKGPSCQIRRDPGGDPHAPSHLRRSARRRGAAAGRPGRRRGARSRSPARASGTSWSPSTTAISAS